MPNPQQSSTTQPATLFGNGSGVKTQQVIASTDIYFGAPLIPATTSDFQANGFPSVRMMLEADVTANARPVGMALDSSAVLVPSATNSAIAGPIGFDANGLMYIKAGARFTMHTAGSALWLVNTTIAVTDALFAIVSVGVNLGKLSNIAGTAGSTLGCPLRSTGANPAFSNAKPLSVASAAGQIIIVDFDYTN